MAFDEYFDTRRSMLGFDFNGSISSNIKYSILASYNDYRRTRLTYIKDLTSLEEQLTNNPEDHDTTDIITWMSRGALRFLPENKKVNWELGYDINQETATGKRIENGQQSMGDYAVFSTAEWRPVETMTIKPGLRYAYNTVYNAPLIPSINVRFQRQRTALRFSYAQGFRAPSLKELYFEFVDINHNIHGNQQLQAESSHNFQFDVTYKIVKGQRITSLEGGMFFNQISDMISLAQTSTNNLTFTYVNIGEFRSQGLELAANHAF